MRTWSFISKQSLRNWLLFSRVSKNIKGGWTIWRVGNNTFSKIVVTWVTTYGNLSPKIWESANISWPRKNSQNHNFGVVHPCASPLIPIGSKLFPHKSSTYPGYPWISPKLRDSHARWDSKLGVQPCHLTRKGASWPSMSLGQDNQ